MNKSSQAIKALTFVAALNLVPKKIMRQIGDSYDNMGRVISRLVREEMLVELNIGKEVVLSITEKGEEYLGSFLEIDKETILRNKKRIKGDQNKKRQIKLSYSLSMLLPFSPLFLEEHLRFEREYSSFIHLNAFKGIQTRQEKIAKMQKEISQRTAQQWILLTREMREIDNDGMKNISASRAQGIVSLSGTPFVFYNHMSARMKAYGDFESRYKDIVCEVLGLQEVDCLMFAKSYKVAIDTITKTPLEDMGNYVGTLHLYKRQFYIPLSQSGAKQLRCVATPNFRKIVRSGLLSPDAVSRAENTSFDGLYEDGTIMCIGLECDINELLRWYNGMKGPYANRRFKVYCFDYQLSFYEKLFQDFSNVELIEINYTKLMSMLCPATDK